MRGVLKGPLKPRVQNRLWPSRHIFRNVKILAKSQYPPASLICPICCILESEGLHSNDHSTKAAFVRQEMPWRQINWLVLQQWQSGEFKVQASFPSTKSQFGCLPEIQSHNSEGIQQTESSRMPGVLEQ